MKWIAGLAVLGLLPAPRAAHAGGSCGGGGSSGGSSSGGDSSSSSSSDSGSSAGDSYAAESHKACIDDTDVVGFRKCKEFGTWAGNMRVPRLFVELGTNVRQFGSGLGAQTGHIAHGSEQFAYRTIMSPTTDAPSDTAMTTALRLGIGLRRGFYAGVEGELGGLTSVASASPEMMSTGTFGAPTLVQQRGLVMGAVGVAGFRGSAGRATFALEGAGGVRHVRYNFESTYHHCIDTSTIAVSRAIVEARARGELWLNPWITAGATLGSNVLDRGDWVAGVFLGVHSRAFGGAR